MSKKDYMPASITEYQPQRCRARSKARGGEQCGNYTIPGGTVCRIHGGGSPQTKRKAALRLLELVDPAIATLARTMTDASAPHAARLRAAENVLDRAGVPRKVDVSDTDAAKALLVERLLALREAGLTEDDPLGPTHEIVQGRVADTDEQEN